jgi:hypothetical protein
MTAHDPAAARATGTSVMAKPSHLPLLFFSLALAYFLAFATMLAVHLWIWTSDGKLAPFDFVDVYAAGKLALAGHAAAAYDWPLHRAAEATALAHPISWKDYLGWHYPPTFFFVAAGLATLPYLAAFFAWSLVTLPLYLLAVQRAAGRAGAWLAACAFPATFFTIAVGQNGFITAALMGGGLAALETSPVLAGLLLGLLSYKPQFGILIPFALAAGGYWRGFIAAAVTAVAMAGASWLAFGGEPWTAFFHSIPVTVDAVLVRGMAGWAKLNSLYGFSRWNGLGPSLASAIQAGAIALSAIASILLWRDRRAPLSLKAAGLIVASLLSTPYLYVYDLPVLAIALAFLVRMAPFDRFEYAAATLAVVAIAAFPFADAPTALPGVIAVALIVLRRALAPADMPAGSSRWPGAPIDGMISPPGWGTS